MSHTERPRDLWSLIGTAHRLIRAELRGDHGNPARTALARLVATLIIVGFYGSTLWSAFIALLPTILIIAAVVVVMRLIHRFLQP